MPQARQRGVGPDTAAYLEKGVLAPFNAAMVEKARGVCGLLGGQIASARPARETLEREHLKAFIAGERAK